MFLDFIATQLQFLQHNDESSVFLPFPIQTRKVIAKEAVSVFLNGGASISILSSPNHVRVIMECVGQAFGLPINSETVEIIEQATELYRRWLLDDKARPPPLQEDEQSFFKEIFNHFSLLFEPRDEDTKGDGTNVDPHSKLCINVLEIIRKTAKETYLSPDTWEHLLKVVLGTTDSLLHQRSPGATENTSLAQTLCPYLLKVLFEIWLRSGTDNDLMWQNLKDLIWHWRHRMPTIQQWNATCFGITNRILRIMYGPSVGTENVTIMLEDSATEIALEVKYVYYAWYRMLHILGDLETIPLPPNYFEALKGVSTLIRLLSDVEKRIKPPPGTSQDKIIRAPDGNTILHIAGPFLLEAINLLRDGFEKGKAEALEAACKFFISHSKTTNFDQTYLAYFYRGLEVSIRSSNPLLISVILKNTTNFFACEFNGSHVLIPAFIYALRKVLPTSKHLEGSYLPSPLLRKACISILGNIICYGNHYGDTLFAREWKSDGFGREGSIKSYKQINDHLNFIMLEGLKEEQDVGNQQDLLWTIAAYIYETVHSNKEFAQQLISLLLRQIVAKSATSWKDQVILTCFRILSDLSSIHKEIFSGDDAGSGNVTMSGTNKDTPHFLVTHLCKFFEISSNTQCAPSPPPDSLIVECINCIQSWVLAGNWIFFDKTCFQMVLSVIDKTLGDTQNYYPPTEKLKEATHSLFAALLNQHGQFPSPIGPSRLSALPSESDLLAAEKLTSKNISCYIFNNTLLSVIRHHRNTKKGIAVTLILRDMTGKYVWNTSLNYFPVDIPEYVDDEKYDNTINPFGFGDTQAEKVSYLDDLMKFLDDENTAKHNALLKQVEDRIASENDYLKKTDYGDAYVEKRHQPPPLDLQVDTTPSRLFLSHLGFLSLENRSSFLLLQSDLSKPFNFLQNFKAIDNTNERECFSVGIVYARAGNVLHSPDEVYGCQEGSADYFEFLSKIGWTVDLASHKGFSGGLEAASTGPVTPYYADLNSEVVFHVATLMPNKEKETGQIHKKRLISNDKVIISWVENIEEYDFKCVDSSVCKFNVIINPLKSGLYRVRVNKLEATKMSFGPIYDEMVVGKHVLPLLARQTAVNVCKSLTEDRGKPLTIRKFLIGDFKNKHKIDSSLSKFYSSQFTMADKLSLGGK